MKNERIISTKHISILQKYSIEINPYDYKKGDNILDNILSKVEYSKSSIGLPSEYNEHTDSWDRDWDKSYD